MKKFVKNVILWIDKHRMIFFFWLVVAITTIAVAIRHDLILAWIPAGIGLVVFCWWMYFRWLLNGKCNKTIKWIVFIASVLVGGVSLGLTLPNQALLNGSIWGIAALLLSPPLIVFCLGVVIFLLLIPLAAIFALWDSICLKKW